MRCVSMSRRRFTGVLYLYEAFNDSRDDINDEFNDDDKSRSFDSYDSDLDKQECNELDNVE